MNYIYGLQIGIFMVLALLVVLLRLRKKRDINIRYASLTVEELEIHAKRVAQDHSVTSKHRVMQWPLTRMNENYAVILSLYNDLNEVVSQKRSVPPAAEWLLDNFYVLEEQVKGVQKALTKKEYYQLPGLKKGPFKGHSRVYAIAVEYVSMVDGRIEEGSLLKYLEAYQSHSILFDREIRIIPIMLNIALVEHIRVICEKIKETQIQWKIADEIIESGWTDEVTDPEKIVKLFKRTLEKSGEANPSFVEHLFYRLRRSGRSYSGMLRYIDELLGKYAATTELIAQKEHNAQAVSSVSLGNCIVSVKYISSLNWSRLFEAASFVEAILRTDPDGTYLLMDETSRSYYLRKTEKLARGYGVSEIHIAREAIALAQKAVADDDQYMRRRHVGYYLVGEGKKELEEAQRGSNRSINRLGRMVNRHPKIIYMGAIIIVTALLVQVALDYGIMHLNNRSSWILAAVAAAVLIPTSELAISLINWMVTRLKKPSIFPRLELKEGIPESLGTMVVVPALLGHANRVKELLANIENHYLANTEDNLYFALIGAFKDSKGPNTIEDNEILKTAEDGIRRLNRLYAKDGKDIFFFYHRFSVLNENDQVWTGWERKRGALMEFNEMLLGSEETSFSRYSDNRIPEGTIKYIITLDADTVLPLDMAKNMIGTMAHPLNMPVVDPDKGIVVAGYGLMQPRISFDVESSNRSVFSRIFTGQEGMDPYASAISDVYQDLFDEGIYTGKGIYDLRVFSEVLKDVVPENAVLSHDLLEGSYVRAALVTDLELVDSYPTRYNAYMTRLHRWIRGDWQLIPWLSRTIVNKNLEIVKNPLSYVSIWKIADNLRRSLVAPSIMVLFVAGFSLLPGSALFWTGYGLVVLVFPLFIHIFSEITSKSPSLNKVKRHIPGFFGLRATFYQLLLALVFLPHQAVLIMNAVCITLYRVLFSKKKMLEWITSDDAERGQSNTLASYIKSMGPSILMGVLILVFAYTTKPDDLILSVVLLGIWSVSPFVAYQISKSIDDQPQSLESEDCMELKRIAHKTWQYFETFANEKNNWLAPDNYQEEPNRGIAYRTSPTNIGLGLLATLSAKDLGYIGIVEAVDTLSKTVATIEKLEKWNGHLYNWYDTRTLEPLKPRYVSTVDSGNLAGYLMTLSQGLRSYYEQPLADEAAQLSPWAALMDQMPEVLLEESQIARKEKLLSTLMNNGSIKNLPHGAAHGLELIDQWAAALEADDGLTWLGNMRNALVQGQTSRQAFIRDYENLIGRIDLLASDMKFDVLFDEYKKLFSIGYDREENRLTNSYYDLLASEARQASYIAIARGEVPSKHWFMLGRSLAVVDRFKGLVSWSGTMFEYLMPLLIMKRYRNTLLDETYSFVIKCQKKYAREKKMPWGISESAFNSLDIHLDYQYKAIGIPWIGLKRGLIEDAVAAPYATFLALMVAPADAFANIQVLKSLGLEGPYGYYEAIDYTPERLGVDSKPVIIKSYMAHHQGMTLMALNNYLNSNIMQERFSADPHVKAARLLLQERVPMNVVITKESKEKILPYKGKVHKDRGSYRRLTGIREPLPSAHILSNGIYSVMTTDRGTGYSRMKNMAVTRWRQDQVLDGYGTFFYVKNKDENRIWSSTYCPVKTMPDSYEVVFTGDKAVYKRTDGLIETTTEVIVASSDNAEIRRIKLKNNGKTPCSLELTSYCEVVLTTQNSDLAHPAFSNLFVETGFDTEYKALVANRRARSAEDKMMWMAQMPVAGGETSGEIQYETDRMQFVGRGRNVSNPIMIERDKPLSNNVGAVLDPIMSMRVQLNLDAGEDTSVSFVTMVADSKEGIMELVEKYASGETCDAAFWLAVARSEVEAKYLNIKAADMEKYQNMIADILFLSPVRRNSTAYIQGNHKGQDALWAYGISGDNPIVLVILDKVDEVEILFEVLKAHEYWRLKGLNVELAILTREENSYENPLSSLVKDIVYTNQTGNAQSGQVDVFILNENNMAEDDIYLLSAVARLIFLGNGETMESQMAIEPQSNPLPLIEGDVVADGQQAEKPSAQYMHKEGNLHFSNGLGGFDQDETSYLIQLEKDQTTPAPWANVIANPAFGFIATESGGGYTWCGNSRENKLTPWSNDPVSDQPSETFYIRDESLNVWSPTPLPIREKELYKIRHGFGYTEFQHESHDLYQRLTQFVPVEGSVKISLLHLKNEGERVKSLSVMYYAVPVMGVEAGVTGAHLISSQLEKGTLVVENPYNQEFKGQIMFMDTSMPERTVTGNRNEVFESGCNIYPSALKRTGLSNTVGAGYNPCMAMAVSVEIQPGDTADLVFVLGAAVDREATMQSIGTYIATEQANYLLDEVKRFWQEKLQVIQVYTPDSSMNIMMNGWLQYQVISCRLWARSAFYQAGGAFGFRDQLQDCLALAPVWPQIVKEQLLKHAKHQFVEGDVLHWWHEPSDKGMRTRISDDYLWLPFVTADYVEATGDEGILNLQVPFVEDDVLKTDEEEKYIAPRHSDRSETLYKHCLLSLDHGLNFGKHGLPLMGTGDWNDGMNRVGNGSKGESVWLAWFLYAALQKFIPICSLMGDSQKAMQYEKVCVDLARDIDEFAWDGNWYKRAFFDNGQDLGSAHSSECQIDSLAQSWAVISGAGDPKRAKRAMDSLEDYLVNREEGVIKLLTPPFNDGDLEPGYIKGYLPGVRENGGQYTHAAAWVVEAFAKLGNGDKAFELFGLINPINHTRTNHEISVYKAEPYVMAADVYGNYPHAGRGGWTWYTGSASWTYKVGLESILGFKKAGDQLIVDPCIPKRLTDYFMKYRFVDTVYEIQILNPEHIQKGVRTTTLDGVLQKTNTITMMNDGKTHRLEVTMGINISSSSIDG